MAATITNQARQKLVSLVGQSRRGFGSSVYLWTSMPRLGPKASELKQQFQIPKGTPTKIEAFEKLDVQTLRIGIRHSAAISADGQLYTFGNGNWGTLGHGTEKDVRFDQPQLVEYFEKKNKKIADVSLGEYHTAALTTDGEVYTWGYGGKATLFNWMITQEVGGLGHGDKKHHFIPKKVDYFEKNNIKVKHITAGLYHTIAISDTGDLYTWGRGLFGVLGNASNSYSLTPMLNDEFDIIRKTNPKLKFKKVEAADEYTGALLNDGSLYVWGKNDRGQLGTGTGIGIDMVESENVPVPITVLDKNDQVHLVKDFHPGQNTMMVRDDEDNIYKVGHKLDYQPKQIDIFSDDFKKEDVSQIACGRKHYIVLNKQNNMRVWGSIFKDKPESQQDGFGLYYGDKLFNEGKIKDLSVKYSIFGALVDHK